MSGSVQTWKRCPFCGSMDIVLRDNGGHRWVECIYCEARGPRVSGDHAKERAVMMWNVLSGKGTDE